MVLVAKLELLTIANTSGLQKSFSRGAASIEGFGKSLFGINLKANLASAAIQKIGGMAMRAASSMIGMVKAQFESIDKANKLSSSLGFSSKAFLGLQHGADLAGISAEGFGSSMGRMTKVIGEAMSGSKEAADSFAELGLDVESLSKMSGEDRIFALADAIEKLGWNAQTTATLSKIFGRTVGPDMLQFLGEGSKGLKAYIADAAKLGIAFDEVTGAKVEASNDALNRLQKVFMGIANTIAIELVPYIKVFSDWLVDLTAQSSSFGQSATTSFGSVGNALKAIGSIAVPVAQIFYMAFKSMQVAVIGLIYGILEAWRKTAEFIDNSTANLPERFRTNLSEKAKSVSHDFLYTGKVLLKELKDVFMADWGADFEKRINDALAANDKAARELADKRKKLAGMGGGGEKTPGMIRETPRVAAAYRGTVEAYSAELRARQAMDKANDPQLKIQREQLAVAKDQQKILGQIENKIGAGPQLAAANL